MGSGRFSLILHNIYSTLFRPHMPYPNDIFGIFQEGVIGPMGPESWERQLCLDDRSTNCYIDHIVFCKCKDDKKHEFLLISVCYPDPNITAKALVVVDRSPSAPSPNSSVHTPLGSAIVSPSVSDTPAHDRIVITKEDDKTELTKPYKPYRELCTLTFSESCPSNITGNYLSPSVRQLCILLKVINKHAPLYNLYEHQCYWFANTVFDTLKKLFPNAEEKCSSHDMRGNYHGLKFDHRNSIETISEEYDRAWSEACDRVREEQRKREESRRKLIQTGRDEGNAEREQLKAESARRDAERLAEIAQLKARLREYEDCQPDNAAAPA
ncbi:hypothetical protein SERLADRAFT_464109 [Serpula lacrymans var. lacrymans S7.9]|uniref:Uncharacterized protein n=1 Tax=Serpula lacrymans var. lacrymans (strain S7.9) TaxID=578457 RepID=F8NR84_SERL9|nr:uncharacterized protein SERLADRAFT_464109 [Serpula lacrymans var. lacrymans S7.9]EGO26731.1 hypothetical protein SERLADRAFT_464109 [Serpula lacrymans var. lacrymans S7.9]